MIDFLKPYLGVVGAVLVVGVALGLFAAGVWIGADHVQAKWDASEASRLEAERDLARETRRAFDTITAKSRKEREDALTAIAALRADVRSGAVRLSVPVASCAAGDSGAGNQQARAELLPETADTIVDVAGDANQTVRELNECIDKYNALNHQ